MVTRKGPPAHVRREALIEAGYRCAIPTCRTVIPVHLHHIDEVSKGGGHTIENVIVLCPTCHGLYHSGQIDNEAIKVYKSMLAALNHAFDINAIDNLLFLHRNASYLMLSGDGVLKFASLISAGLASVDEYHMTGGRGGLNLQSFGYRVHLSEKGRRLVEAWEKGDEGALQSALVPAQ